MQADLEICICIQYVSEIKIVKQFLYCVLFFAAVSCNRNQTIVKPVFIDSLLTYYTPSKSAIVNEKDLKFWKQRAENQPENFVDLSKYSSALVGRFHIYGDINDLKTADSIMQNIATQYKEPGMLLSLAGYKMLQHQFLQAKNCIDAVVETKAEKYAAQMMLFDADFELGDEYHSSMILKQNCSPLDYAYNFRLSKYDHFKGELDSSISHMMQAALLAGSSPYLKNAALSNAADLYVHEGDLKKASELYEQCIRFNSCDFHSMMGLGWIALVHDGNDSQAKKIFSFVRSKLKSPDPLLKLSQANEMNDIAVSKKFAVQFAQQAANAVYGNMYNKYLIQVYTSVLNEPAKALTIAEKEMSNRRTPQTGAWLAWCLFVNNKKEEAYKTYQQFVSGRPLEALELYWMGKMMKGLEKGYNAQQFFKAAQKNKYDLSPLMRKDLDKNLID